MRVFGLWLCFTALVLVAAPVLSVAAPPAPDPAPAPTPTPAPAPDPAPAAQPPAAETRSAPVARTPPPVDARPVRVVAPARVAVPVPASRPAPKRREARRERTSAGAAGTLPAPLQRATAWPRLPLKPVTGETADRGPLLRAAVGLLLLVAAGTASLRLMVRIAGPALVVLAVLAGLPAEARAAPALTYACSPAPANCLGWYRSSVTVRWDWDQLIAMPNGGNCFETRFTNDTATARANCEIRELGDPFMTTAHSVPIRIDRVPPTGQGFTSSRPPDYGGWFNRPVTLSFKGSDGTSGVAGCDTVGFGGPDGQAVPVSGRCRDRAGNVGTASYTVAYDATPPGAPRAQALPGHRRVSLTWSLPADGLSVEVVRLDPGADVVLYRGAGRRYTGRELRNGVRYRYRVGAVDRAGNRSWDETSAVPTSSPLLVPANGGRLKQPPLLIWKPVKRARYYNVQLFRAGRKVLSRWPRTNRLQLRGSWRFAGRRRRLVAGRYTWFVWPGEGRPAARKYGRALGKRKFVVVR